MGDNSNDELEFKINTNILKKINTEAILLAVFIIALLSFMSVFDGGKLLHNDGPHNFLAGDMFTFSAFADVAKYQNDIMKQPDYMSSGRTDNVNFFSMIGAIIEAQLSSFVGGQSYDFIIHINLLFLLMTTFIVYYFLRKINFELAILSLPLSLLVYGWPFQYTITWGMHLSQINILFVACSLLCLLYLDVKYMWIILGLLNGAGVLSHAREFLMFNIAIAFYFLARLIKEGTIKEIAKSPSLIKKYLKENQTVASLKNYIFSIPITLLMMFRMFPVLSSVAYGPAYDGAGINGIFAYIPPTQFHHVYFPQFGFYEYLIAIGSVIALYLVFKEKDRKTDIIMIFALTFLLHGFFSILNNKTTQIRHIFPILLMPLVGITVYLIYTNSKKMIKVNSIIVVFLLFLALLIPTYLYFMPQTVSDYAFSDPYTWEAMNWMSQHAEASSKTWILYGDRHNQETLFLLMRHTHVLTNSDSYASKIKNNTVSSSFVARGGHVHIYTQKLPDGTLQTPSWDVVDSKEERSICNYDYLMTDKVSQDPTIQSYTRDVLDRLVKESNFVPVFQNDLVVILKNNKVGGPCFKDGVFENGK